MSKVLLYVKETFKGGGDRLHALPLKYQQITLSFKYTQISIDTILKQKEIKPVFEDSKFEVLSNLVFIDEIHAGQYFGETGGFVLNVSEELDDGKNGMTGIKAEREFMSFRQWYGKDGNCFSGVSVASKGRVELLGVSKIDFLAYANNDAWQVIWWLYCLTFRL